MTEILAKNVFEAVEEGLEFHPKPASGPTYALPGSDEKIRVMRLRALEGQELYHPDDRTLLINPRRTDEY